MENLRKVEYTLQGEEELGFNDYENDEEREKALKERKGLFHRWGESYRWIDNKYYSETFGIIEDDESHQIMQVVPKRIKFIED